MSKKLKVQSKHDEKLEKIKEVISNKFDFNYDKFWSEFEKLLEKHSSKKNYLGEYENFKNGLEEIHNSTIKKYHEDFEASMVSEDLSEYFSSRHFRYSFYDLYPINPPEQKSIIVDETKRIQKILFDVYKNNRRLLDLNAWEFEEVIAELLFKQGYKVELTQKTKDNGYDILALLDVKGQLPIKYLVECKKYAREKVGVEIIRSFKEVMATEKANRGMIVTTSYFTAGALDKQREIPYLLDYRDKDKVIEWVKEYFK